MLIDAAHAEETRVAVVDGTHVDEFDFESRAVKQLRGNIYLAKVTRVEPSLQAAFIEYGGNRHGFLAFNEIHPDYFQIPVADREKLLREVETDEDHPDDALEDEDADDEAAAAAERRKRRLLRRYKIQDVIKRRQIMLVQVVKEERGNKGAALTTYLSLAGRYCVLMPNTARGGGISRKITAVTDRKRLKSAAASLDVPEGMGLIIRTAGAKRTKAEIKRDYEYLIRLWENIRETTLNSIAPALIYEEEDLVKRAIRDMYDKELDGICVEGEQGYRDAKEFMRVLMPSQAKKVTPYRDPTPLFVHYKVEDQLALIHSPVVPLRSGGYLVINQTEALVAVDVNSGKSTRERNVEATALKTNLEAAEEVTRQLRLRDLAGLIVIDFIDMDESKNNRAVEKVLKDGLSLDRARVQMGKISSFGLMEVSRQRRRSGLLEGTTHTCPHCEGLGRVRSTESSALLSLRALQIEAAKGGVAGLTLRVCTAVGLYILNEKRAWLQQLEETAGLRLTVSVDPDLPVADHAIERIAYAEGEERVSFQPRQLQPRLPEPVFDDVDDDVDDEAEDDEPELVAAEDRPGAAPHVEPERESDREGRGGRRRSRRRRGGRGRDDVDESTDAAQPLAAATAAEHAPRPEEDDSAEGEASRRRRRGRRGGRRGREEDRARDPYVWFRPRSEDPADVYAWSDPHAAERRPEPRPVAEMETVEVESTVTAEAAPFVSASDAETPVKAPRPRRRRGRRSESALEAAPAEEAVHAGQIDAEPQLPEDGIDDQTTEPSPAPASEPAETPTPASYVVATAEPELQAALAAGPLDFADPEPPLASELLEPELSPEPAVVTPAANDAEPVPPPVVRAQDPNEITAPPAQPKRGWWRGRG
jgi:ribonuclease E